jgi:predicted alpha/beta hydrolase family esterase
MPGKRQLLFIQGAGHGTHDDWDSKLVHSLQDALKESVEIRYPRMPGEDDPSYGLWKPVLEQEIRALPSGAVLVGHSVGGTVLIRFLTEQAPPPAPSGIVIIAAPFLGDGGWSIDGETFPPDLGERLPKDVPIHFYHGLADESVPPSHVECYARAVPYGHVHCLPGRNHQLNDDLSEVAAMIASF